MMQWTLSSGQFSVSFLILNYQACYGKFKTALHAVELCPPTTIQSRLTLLETLESILYPQLHRVFKSNVRNVEIITIFCRWTYFHRRLPLLKPSLHKWESSCGCLVAGKEAELVMKCWARFNSLYSHGSDINHWYSSFCRVIGIELSPNQLINR